MGVPTFVAAGTSSRATNGATAPGLPAGLADGDLMILLDGAVYWGGGPATPGTPAGWTQIITFQDGGSTYARITLMARTYATGDTAPSVTYTGGASSNHYSQIYAFRGLARTSLTDVLGTGSSCASSNTACGPISGLATTGASSLVFVAAIRDDTMTSSTVLAGDGLTWTKGTDFSDATTDGLSAWCDWAVAPAAQAVTAKTATVAGNAAEAAGVMWSVLAETPPPRPAVSLTAVQRAATW